ncbi:MAG: hypothetical protein FD189_1083 [Elusimicrobia bacterium]|nr:MAG: hypothetical protein FD189_1083 [Elusimicrobiota bacterium]
MSPETFRSFRDDGASPEQGRQTVQEVLAKAQELVAAIERPTVFIAVMDPAKKSFAAFSAGPSGDAVTMLLSISKQLGGWLVTEARKP